MKKIFERKGKKLVKRSVGSKFFLLLLQRGVGVGWGRVGVCGGERLCHRSISL